MGELRTYPHGVTSWIDTEQPDLEAARVFYAGLFGWRTTDGGPSGAPGSYLIATLGGQDVAAVAATPAASAGKWNTYVAVDNADATAAAVAARGGAVIAPPENAGRAGRAATCADPSGAEFHAGTSPSP
jgi:uncharacterized protein